MAFDGFYHTCIFNHLRDLIICKVKIHSIKDKMFKSNQFYYFLYYKDIFIYVRDAKYISSSTKKGKFI